MKKEKTGPFLLSVLSAKSLIRKCCKKAFFNLGCEGKRQEGGDRAQTPGNNTEKIKKTSSRIKRSNREDRGREGARGKKGPFLNLSVREAPKTLAAAEQW